jgi:cytoskeleton protein RodZ
MDVGNELRQARQQAGLSREEIAQSTKIQLAKIEALEANAFGRLPDGIYLDGIVKAYARTVGLDPDVMVQRVHAERERQAGQGSDELAGASAAATAHDFSSPNASLAVCGPGRRP